MPEVVHIGGGAKLALVAKALRHLGTDRTIINEAGKNIRKAAPKIRAAIRKSADDTLPKEGGFNRWVAAAKIRVQILRSARKAGIALIVGRDSIHGRSDIARIDAGTTRHPLYGHRRHWYLQAITPGYASNVMKTDAADELRGAINAALDTAVEQVLDVL